MRDETLDANYGRRVGIDFCSACAALWFDARESLALTPGATLRLFTLIHERSPGDDRRPPSGATCPRCAQALVATADRQRNTRFHYWRCSAGHGRFITFAEFLREKNFVRPLDTTELAALRAHVRSVQCSNCGGGVDLEQGSACRYCRTPVSMLDPQQVEAVVQQLRDAEVARTHVDPALPARLAMERLEIERLWQAMEPATGRGRLASGMPRLLEAGLAVVADLLGKR
jgi:hypothetical protein